MRKTSEKVNSLENITLAGSKNVRDLGGIVAAGGTVRNRLLLRGGNLFACTPRDVTILRDKYGLSLIVDLRTSSERDEKPDVCVPGAENVHMPLFAESTLGITRERSFSMLGELAKIAEYIPDLDDLYRLMVSADCRHELALAVQTVMNAVLEGRTVLFHCAEGKDRTGLMASILLSMLGASREAIMADYLFTNTVNMRKANRYYRILRLLTRDRAAAEKMRAVFEARAEYLDAALDSIDEDWGGMDAFVEQGLGVDSACLNSFRQMAIE